MCELDSSPSPNREERAAITFEPLPVFDWTNERWAETHLPIIRLASLFLAEPSRDDLRVRIKAALAANEDVVPEALEDFNKTRDHLKSLGAIRRVIDRDLPDLISKLEKVLAQTP